MATKDELKILQALPLELKVARTKQRIREWVSRFGVDGVYVSFSGGKDSTVLLHIVRELYPEVEAVFVNTGLEYPEIQKFVKTFDNVTILRPKMRFDEVIKKYGYPFISKEVSQVIYYARLGSVWANNYLNGLDSKGRPHEFKKAMYSKFKSLLDIDFPVSDKCCRVIKEKPLNDYEKQFDKKPIVATMATESKKRETAWLQTGCNLFRGNRAISKPMSFLTEQDVLQYIKENNIPIASIYGDIVTKSDNGDLYDTTLCDCGCKLKCTGAQRTGCIFCGFGAHLDKKEGLTRFERLKQTHPRQYEYCMGGGAYDTDGFWKPTKEGLGMKHCIDELNKIYGKDFIKY